MSRSNVAGVVSSGFLYAAHLSVPLVEELVRTAMLRGVIRHSFRFGRGADARPRAYGIDWDGLVTAPIAVDPTPTIPTGVNPELLGMSPSAPPPAAPAAAPDDDVLVCGLPSIEVGRVPAVSPIPLPAGVPAVDEPLPDGATLLDALVTVQMPVEFRSMRFSELPALRDAGTEYARLMATVEVRPVFHDGVLEVRRHRIALEVLSAGPGTADLAVVGDAILAEVHACLVAVIRAWSHRPMLAGQPFTAAGLDVASAMPALVLARGSGDPSRLRSCLDTDDRVGFTARQDAPVTVDVVAETLPIGLPAVVLRRHYADWSAAVATAAPIEFADVAGGRALFTRGHGVLLGEPCPIRLTAIRRNGRAITHYAFNDAFYMTRQRAADLVARGEMRMPDGVALVRSKSGAFLRDAPDAPGAADPTDNLGNRPRFSLDDGLVNAGVFEDFVAPGLYTYRAGATLGQGPRGLPGELDAFPRPPTAVVITVHGIHNDADDDNDGFVRAIQRHHQPDRMEGVRFMRMYWGYDDLYQGSYQPGERVDVWSGMSDRAWAGVAKLKELVGRIRSLCGDVPITIAAHSQGSVVTVTALQEGLKVENWLIMGSPLGVETVRSGDGNLRFADAAANVRGRVVNLWSGTDDVAWMKHGIGNTGLPRSGETFLGSWWSHEGGRALDIAGYPRDGRYNVADIKLTRAGLRGFVHDSWFDGAWLADPGLVQWEGGSIDDVIAPMLGDNVASPPVATATAAVQRAVVQGLDAVAAWANSDSTGSWWLGRDDNDHQMSTSLHLLPRLMTTFHADNVDVGTTELSVIRGAVRFRMAEAIVFDRTWESPWYALVSGQHHRIRRRVGSEVYDGTLLVEVENLGDGIAEVDLAFDAHDV